MLQIKILRFVGISEGVSFLVLLCIAMPLKYVFAMPLLVKYVGWAHSALFIAYVIMVFASIRIMRWSWLNTLVALGASLLPLGTFFLDKSWRKREADLSSNK